MSSSRDKPGWTGPFELVRLAEPYRRCITCVSPSWFSDFSVRHHKMHGSTDAGSYLPHRWRVAAELPGDAIPVGTTLSVIGTDYQDFREVVDSSSIFWLLEAEDGPKVGAIFSVLTSANWGPSFTGSADELTKPEHPLWPEGLKVHDRWRGSTAQRLRATDIDVAAERRDRAGR